MASKIDLSVFILLASCYIYTEVCTSNSMSFSPWPVHCTGIFSLSLCSKGGFLLYQYQLGYLYSPSCKAFNNVISDYLFFTKCQSGRNSIFHLFEALKQDFSEVDGSWHTAAELSTITCSACLGYVPENKIEFKQQFLPDVVASLLVVAERIQSLVLKTDDVSFAIFEESLAPLLEKHR